MAIGNHVLKLYENVQFDFGKDMFYIKTDINYSTQSYPYIKFLIDFAKFFYYNFIPDFKSENKIDRIDSIEQIES